MAKMRWAHFPPAPTNPTNPNLDFRHLKNLMQITAFVDGWGLMMMRSPWAIRRNNHPMGTAFPFPSLCRSPHIQRAKRRFRPMWPRMEPIGPNRCCAGRAISGPNGLGWGRGTPWDPSTKQLLCRHKGQYWVEIDSEEKKR